MNSSNDLVNSVLNDVKSFDSDYQIQNKFDFTGQTLKTWKKSANHAITILEDHGVNYTLIKAYDVPFALMDDVDILVENQIELRKLYTNLIETGFTFRHVPFNDELKLAAMNKELDVEIDFYPDSKWSELRYAKQGLISQNRIKKTVHGIEAFIPKPEHEIVIIASHAYYHGRINLLEVLHTIRTISNEELNFEEIFQLSKSFHMQNGTLILLSIVDQLLENYGFNVLPKKILEGLNEISQKRFQNLAKKSFEFEDFPIKFSIPDLLCSSLSKITAKNLDGSSGRFDELLGFIKHNRFANSIYLRFSKKYNSFVPN